MLRIVLGIAFLLVLTQIGNFLIGYLDTKPKKSRHGYVRMRKAELIVGILCALFGGGCIYAMLFYHTSRQYVGAILPMGFLFIIGLVAIWEWFSIKIWYNKKGFVVRNFWMVQRKYSYADITGIVDGKHVYIILGNTKIAVVHSMEGGDRFIRTVRERYAEINNGEDIPKAFKIPRRAFNGNVEGANEYAFIITLLALFLGGILLGLYIPPSERTSEYFEGSLDNGYVAVPSGDLGFYLQTQEDPFVIEDFHEYAQNIDQLWRFGSKIRKLFVYAEFVPSYGGREAYYHVCSLSDEDGTVYVTFDMTWQQDARRRIVLTIGIGILFVGMAVYGAACLLALRNPKKYKRLARICFRKDIFRD